jgi:hypothetical protein
MWYINLLNKNIDIYPIFWKWEIKNPTFLSMDDDSLWVKWLNDEQIKNQVTFNHLIIEYWILNYSDLIISGFLEKRERMFNSLWFIQMVNEKRFYHLWLDLSISKWNYIYAPLDWEVYESWYEDWDWNYWGYIVLKHNIEWFVFYSLYWHQYKKSIPEVWVIIKKWEIISQIWDYSDNWWYFHHLHLQLITQEWIDNWYISKWYIREDEIKNINKYILDPNYIFKY